MGTLSTYFLITTLLHSTTTGIQTGSPQELVTADMNGNHIDVVIDRDALSQDIIKGLGGHFLAVGRWSLHQGIPNDEGESADDFFMEVPVSIPLVIAHDEDMPLGLSDVPLGLSDMPIINPWGIEDADATAFGGADPACIDRGTKISGMFLSPRKCDRRAFAATMIAFGQADVYDAHCFLRVGVNSGRIEEFSLGGCQSDGIFFTDGLEIPISLDNIVRLVIKDDGFYLPFLPEFIGDLWASIKSTVIGGW